MTVEQYCSEKKSLWDDLIQSSKNGHFMFYRDYMEYHADRFDDYSLMFFDEKKRLIAVMPANIKGEIVYSHQGLSFGGLILSFKATAEIVHDIFLALIEFLKSSSTAVSLIYKRTPDFYHLYSAQEDLYSLFLFNAELIRRDLSVCIDLLNPIPFQDMRKRKVKKAKKNNIEVQLDTDFASFWNVLNEVLKKQHGVQPVHSLEEINHLKSIFPDNIKCFSARLNGEILAGTVIYETQTVAHAQYLASNDKGRELGALDLVIDFLIKDVYKDKKYFDFGISTESDGRFLNKGLISQKEGFGARGQVHDFYEIKLV
ncbi:GNAT family N-acetyltransferase [Thiomicrorhabdus sediminis]|uniref:GNAT family N-acetyltransferase n=1 Tax=Thiomicrorhabdus sediminis TaxID=2580412 RepID=A0A4P9K7Z7_9GAMM|nr:GNAT family N-acetyltransferase [Thiomicrorhabdus sediminis]